MFNERAVCQAIIDCCCDLDWPASRLKIQILDDSTDKVTRELVDEKVLEWRERGINIDCLRRTNRQGYKAGAMKEGMDLLIAEGYRYVAVFDADFKPESDFLEKTVPYLESNPTVGYVQSRWVFTNPEESYLTKVQEVSLNYHMKCEQYTHSAYHSFFNFNGTAGVWRSACIADAGGWNSRTTVEDMDLSLRAYIKEWKAIFLEDVTCLNELPASFFAYRKQQHRWTCGPIQLWSKASKDIWASSLPFLRKLELISIYFGVRKCTTHFVSLGFFCTLVPLTVFVPEVTIPTWALIHLPVCVTLLTSAFTPKGWAYCILYVLFENTMGTVKMWAVINGLLDLERAQEWVVTTKLGSSDKRPGTALSIPSCKAYPAELFMAAFTLSAGFWALFAGRHWGMVLYLTMQGLVFMAFGLNWVDAGNLLGGRLDENIFKVQVSSSFPFFGSKGKQLRKKTGGKRMVERAATIPIIDMKAEYEEEQETNLLVPGSKAYSAGAALEIRPLLPISTPLANDKYRNYHHQSHHSIAILPSTPEFNDWAAHDNGSGSGSPSSGTRTPDSGYSLGSASVISSVNSLGAASTVSATSVLDTHSAVISKLKESTMTTTEGAYAAVGVVNGGAESFPAKSPSSSLTNIYASGGMARRGFRFSNNGYYNSDHSE
jgi:beta-mannan synthase